MPPFDTLFVADRGETALRIVRTCHDLGIRSVLGHADVDADSPAVRLADRSFCLGPAQPAHSYLNIPAVLYGCAATGAQAVHPGLGPLAQDPLLAQSCLDAGLAFVGPRPGHLALLGDAAATASAMRSAGLPVPPDHGRGTRAGAPEHRTFPARHVAVQVIADTRGSVVHLGDRCCSAWSGGREVFEEAPAPGISERLRGRLHRAALRGARAVGLVNAATFEFLVTGADEFSFACATPRLQAGHPLTEAVTGVDLVEWMVRVAAGEPLGFEQGDVRVTGHAVAARITARAPAPGRAEEPHLPGGPGVRVSTHRPAGSADDPLTVEVVATGPTRAVAVRRMGRALAELDRAAATDVSTQRRVLADPGFRAGRGPVRALTGRAT